MHAHTIDDYRHEHVFLGVHHERNERRTWIVVAICAAMMALEIGGGAVFHSMALVADGLHMSTHAGALVIAALAYSFARRHARDERFTFGAGKMGDLAAFSSALILAMIALFIGWQSMERLIHPAKIAFDQAIPIAALGLGVNLVTAWLLRDEPHPGHDHDHDHHEHDHDHDHAHGHHHHHGHDHHHGQDLNLKAAYVHVAADAAVSVLAILGLTAGRQFGWVFMDPVMGIIGALVIANWSYSLIRATGAVLLDMEPRTDLAHEIEHRLEVGGDKLSDLHVWRLGPGHHAAVVSVVTDTPRPPADYKRRLDGLEGLSHVTVEVEPCPGPHAA
jgi:cation diffusion facilitator family transporter